MEFHAPEVIELGMAESLIAVTIGGRAAEGPPEPEPNYDPIIIYINGLE